MTSETLVSKRIKSARVMVELSQAQLGSLIGKTSQNISQYENATRSPSLDDLTAIANETGKPIGYFTNPKKHNAELSTPLFFRALSAVRSLRHREKWTHKVQQIAELHLWLAERVRYPEVRLPSIPPQDRYSDEELEEIALSVRDFFEIGQAPVINFIALLERHGIIVVPIPIEEEVGTDAFSAYISGRPFIFFNSSKGGSRHRQNLAHELAHLLCHNYLTDEMLAEPNRLARIEREANYFGAAFNMPPVFAKSAVLNSSLRGFEALKAHWGTSIAAMVMRSKALNIISESRAKFLFQQISAKGWRKSEPGEDMVPKDNSRGIGLAAFKALQEHSPAFSSRLISEQHVSEEDICEAFGLKPSDLSPKGFDPVIIEGDFSVNRNASPR